LVGLKSTVIMNIEVTHYFVEVFLGNSKEWY